MVQETDFGFQIRNSSDSNIVPELVKHFSTVPVELTCAET